MRKFLQQLGLVTLLCCPIAVAAQDITLKSADGSIRLSGTLLDYDGEFYTLKTIFGELTFNALGIVCTGMGCPDAGQYAADLTFFSTPEAGSTLLPALIEDFGFAAGETTIRSGHNTGGWTYFVSDVAQIPVARIQAHLGESALAFAALSDQKTDITLTTRTAEITERAAALEAGSGDLTDPYRIHLVALDALVVIVSQNNPVSALSLDDVKKIFTGEIVNWAVLGGIDAPISLYRPKNGTDLAEDVSAVLQMEDQAFAHAIMPTLTAKIADAVAADPFAIGISRFSTVRNSKALAIIGPCGIRTHPDQFNVQSEDYPLTRRLYFTTARKRLPVFARSFLSWVASDAAQNTINAQGYVARTPVSLTLSQQQNRLTNAIQAAGDDINLGQLKGLVRAFAGASRLATTFRFMDSSTKMESRSVLNITQLARQIEVGDFDGHELIFAGFSDSTGGSEGNRRISRQRAEQVAAQVKKAATRADPGKVKFRVIGMGEVSPLACDDTDLGRFTNRRVEVWIK